MKKPGRDPRRLPGGQHGIPRDVVERNQRERLIAAMAEVCAELGYAAVAVADITRQASVSTASFYKQFGDKHACLLASFEGLFGRLLEGVEEACEIERERDAKVKAGIRVAAELLASDTPTARLLTVEIVAGGAEGVRLQHAAIERLAELSGEDWAIIAAMVALVARRVVNGEGLTAAELERCISL
ncbi:MAG TPA: TetR/AcrR family transcriptional regulator [Solirubrobacterales bacterium]|nr:TetR/AcrR family transcriptional regulator [Solirubrobacterales bacterium]